MSNSPVTTEARGDVALLTLARPPANALDLNLLLALGRAVTEAQDARAIVLTGSERFFSAGLDLAYVLTLDEPQALTFAEAFDDTMTTLFAAPGPLVAALSGHTVAGGAVIAAAADFRLMAEGPARIGLPEIKVGVPFPASALEIVRHAWAGPHLARLLFRGDTVDAAEALALGLIDDVVAPNALVDHAVALAGTLAAAPRATYAATKRGLRAPGLARIQAARAAGPDPVWEVWRSPEVRAAIAAYGASVLRRK